MEPETNAPRQPLEAANRESWVTPAIQSLNANEAAVPKFNQPEGGSGSIDLV